MIVIKNALGLFICVEPVYFTSCEKSACGSRKQASLQWNLVLETFE